MTEQLQRLVMQVDYRTVKGAEIKRGEVRQGLQSRRGGHVEILIRGTLERVVFSARECGLPTT